MEVCQEFPNDGSKFTCRELRERDLCKGLARLFRADKIAIQTSGDSVRGEHLSKTGLLLIPRR
jgi:hypothetical protein